MNDKITISELLDREREANKYLDKKGIRTACARCQTLEYSYKPNTLYLAPKGTIIVTPMNEHPELLEKAKAEKWVIEIPIVEDRELPWALIKGAEAVRQKLGAVTLADPVYISYVDKSEIRKLITRLKKSSNEAELKARAEELQALVDGYEERQNDTEREDLQDKFQDILDSLETGQQDLENNNREASISSIEEALFY